MNQAAFEFRGVPYTLPEINQEEKVAVGSIAAANAVMLARAMAKYLPDDEASHQVAEAGRLARSGYFGWDDAGGWTYRHTNEGVVRVIHLCLSRGKQKVSLDDVRAMAEVDNGRWLADLYRQANPDPTPAPPASGGESSGPNSPNSGA